MKHGLCIKTIVKKFIKSLRNQRIHIKISCAFKLWSFKLKRRNKFVKKNIPPLGRIKQNRRRFQELEQNIWDAITWTIIWKVNWLEWELLIYFQMDFLLFTFSMILNSRTWDWEWFHLWFRLSIYDGYNFRSLNSSTTIWVFTFKIVRKCHIKGIMSLASSCAQSLLTLCRWINRKETL